MKITSLELIYIEIPLKRPFETSFGSISERPAIIVKVVADNGTVGYGESSPLSVPISEPETVESGMTFLSAQATALVGIEVTPAFDVTTLYPNTSHPVSRIGLEAAYTDLVAQSLHISLAELFGARRTSLPLGESVSLRDSVEEMKEEVRQFIADGAQRIKLKIAPGRDIEVVEQIRAEFPDVSLGVDANAAYTATDIPLLSKLARSDIAFIEQPFEAHDLEAHAALRSKGLMVCLDESVGSLDDCRSAVEKGACDMINIKPARIGSFREAKRIHDACINAGIRLFGGGRLETGLGKTANAAFYALSGFTDASDITPPSAYLEMDIIEPPFAIKEGMYSIPSTAGLGVAVHEEAVNRYEKERVVLGKPL